MFKTEMHLHTQEVSNCGTVNSTTVARHYLNAGYTTLVLTNHLSRFTYKNKKFDHSSDTWDKKIDFYIAGYNKLIEAAAGRLNIILGVELRSNRDDNDYLIYGIDEQFLRSMPKIMDMKLEELIDAIHTQGGLFYQAHPFRNNIRITNPNILDGIEVYNGHIGQQSRNDIAYIWAEKFGLKKISGSDYHHDTSIIGAGISTAEPVSNSKQLINILKNNQYELIRSGAVEY